jgi:hypothetical protein
VKVGEQKLVLGTLLKDKIPQISLELVLDKEFELSHNSKTASVHFFGYRALFPGDYEYPSSFVYIIAWNFFNIFVSQLPLNLLFKFLVLEYSIFVS